MRIFQIVLTVPALCLVLLQAGEAQARNAIKNDWLDQYPEACAELVTLANNCTLCHEGGGFAVNLYGADLANVNEDFVAVEGVDSDGDGRTNGQEILSDCSAPGDAVSAPATITWSSIKSLF
jgi:hypothetical protein